MHTVLGSRVESRDNAGLSYRIASYRIVRFRMGTAHVQCSAEFSADACVKGDLPVGAAQRRDDSCKSVCCAAMRCSLPSGTSAPAAVSHHFCVAPALLSICFSFRLSDGTPGADAIDIHSTRRLSLPSLCAVPSRCLQLLGSSLSAALSSAFSFASLNSSVLRYKYCISYLRDLYFHSGSSNAERAAAFLSV